MRQLLRITATFALALVFTAGIAFGQNNEVDLEQRDFDNQATIDQTGESNEASLFQRTFGETGVGEVANITQVGTGNEVGGGNNAGNAAPAGAALQQGGEGTNTFNAEQYGTNNEIELTQLYGTNTVNVRQGKENDRGTGNRAFIEQRTVPFLDNGDLQTGVQINAMVTVNQDGRANFTTVAQGTQGDDGFSGKNTKATINQTQKFQGPTPSNFSNVVRLFQGKNATATVDQTGESNRLLDVSGTDAGQLSLVNSQAAFQGIDANLDLTQTGIGNEVGLRQESAGLSSATITQDNEGVAVEGNQVLLYQEGAQTTNVTQMGDGNEASISQQP